LQVLAFSDAQEDYGTSMTNWVSTLVPIAY